MVIQGVYWIWDLLLYFCFQYFKAICMYVLRSTFAIIHLDTLHFRHEEVGVSYPLFLLLIVFVFAKTEYLLAT